MPNFSSTSLENIRYQSEKLASVEYNDLYFSGSNAKIFFGNVWVDDIVTISWDFVEQKAPLYGYASDKFDAVARGTKIVQGVFTIAFKQSDYIANVIDIINSRGLREEDVLEHIKLAKGRKAYNARRDSRSKSGGPVVTYNYEEILDKAKKEDTSMFSMLTAYLEDFMWGNLGDNFTGEQAIDKDKIGNSIVTGFDIIATYGNIGAYAEEYTAKAIGDVHLTGTRQIVNPDGNPIVEAYTFFGKLMDPATRKDRSKLIEGAYEGNALDSEFNPFGGPTRGFSTGEAPTFPDGSKQDITDSEGNNLNDDPFAGDDEGISLGGPRPPAVTIFIPTNGQPYQIVNSVMPEITVQAHLKNTLPADAQASIFLWEVEYTTDQFPPGTRHLSWTSQGPRSGFNLGTYGISSAGHGTIKVSVSYKGITLPFTDITRFSISN